MNAEIYTDISAHCLVPFIQSLYPVVTYLCKTTTPSTPHVTPKYSLQNNHQARAWTQIQLKICGMKWRYFIVYSLSHYISFPALISASFPCLFYGQSCFHNNTCMEAEEPLFCLCMLWWMTVNRAGLRTRLQDSLAGYLHMHGLRDMLIKRTVSPSFTRSLCDVNSNPRLRKS